MPEHIGHVQRVFFVGAPLKIFNRIVLPVSVFVIDASFALLCFNECLCNQSVHRHSGWSAGFFICNSKITIPIFFIYVLLANTFSFDVSHLAIIAHLILRVAAHCPPFFSSCHKKALHFLLLFQIARAVMRLFSMMIFSTSNLS